MKNLYKINRKWLMAGFSGLLLAGILFFSCVYLDSVIYDSTLKANEEATFTVNMHIVSNEDRTTRLILSFLAPKSWNAGEHTKITYVDTYDEGVLKSMSLIPLEQSPLNEAGLTWGEAMKKYFGVGLNVLDDMEWVTYQSDEIYNVHNGDNQSAVIKIVTRVGEENMRVKLSFFITMGEYSLSSADERYFKIENTDCIEVVDGDETLYTDFCEAHFNSVQPSGLTKDDIVTFKFQGEIAPNELDDTNEIYLCAKAFTTAYREYAVTERTAKTRMKIESGRTYSLTFWAADYFGIPEGEEILRVEYYFTNADGSLSVKQTYETGEPDTWFLSMFNCK
ncbi:DUF4961 domain-containing protein [Bacteroidia bacterium]|nr:DUF4961 domain-containing protein [Bacteroidia bacterium]